jgi:TPR repeat protein
LPNAGRQGHLFLKRGACLLMLLVLCAPLAARASDIAPLPAAAINQAAATPEVQNGRAALAAAKTAAIAAKTTDNPNIELAVAAFTKGAARGNPLAQTYLGYLYYTGQGVAQNDRMAAAWYRRAAERGFLDAQLRLGLMLKDGRDLKIPERNLVRDDAQALMWLRRAAGQGSLLAWNEIGLIYLKQSAAGTREQAVHAFGVTAAKDDPIGLAMLCYDEMFFGGKKVEEAVTCQRAKQHPITGPDEDPAIAYLAGDAIPAAMK